MSEEVVEVEIEGKSTEPLRFHIKKPCKVWVDDHQVYDSEETGKPQ